MLAPFTIHQPTSVRVASRLLAELGPDAAVYAGGTELLVVLKERLAEIPHLVDIKRIPELRGIALDRRSGALHIGALTTHREIEKSPLVRQHMPALAALASRVANVRVRSVGTIGGNLCFADPHSDPATLLAALDARLTLESGTGRREVAMESFITGFMATARRHDELLTGITISLMPTDTGVAYERIKLHERPTAAVAAVIAVRDARITNARIVAGAIGEHPQRLPRVESALVGLSVDSNITQSVGALIGEDVETSGDAFESEAYKRQLARAVGVKAIAAAILATTSPARDIHAA